MATKFEPNAQYRIKLNSMVEVPGAWLRPGDDDIVVVGWVAEVIDWAIISSEKISEKVV